MIVRPPVIAIATWNAKWIARDVAVVVRTCAIASAKRVTATMGSWTREWHGWAIPAMIVCIALVLTPTDAWAWTPGTHVFLGDAVLRNLSLLPPHAAELLAAFPSDFLYGSIAADTSIAKKYAAVGRHCHSWNIGLEIRDEAENTLTSFPVRKRI